MSPDLLRQRRNLMATSLVLFFLKYSGIQISEISLFGINMKAASRPESIYIAIWILFFYFLWRFWQFHLEEGRTKFYEQLHRVLFKKVFIKLDISRLKYKYEFNSFNEFTIYSEMTAPADTTHSLSDLHRSIFSQALAFSGAFFHTVTSSTAFTNYYLPILFALSAMIYCSNDWDGALNSINFNLF